MLVKWVPLIFLPLRALEARRTGRHLVHSGTIVTGAVVLAVATWRYGLHWLDAFRPLARNAGLQTSFALPSRLEQLGVPDDAAVALLAVAFAVRLRVASVAGVARPRPAGARRRSPAARRSLSGALVPRLDGAARGGRGGHRGALAEPRALRISSAADGADLMADLLSIDEAIRAVLERVTPLPSEPVPIEAAAGRVLAEAARAAVDLPPFASSAMDGFVLRAEDTPGTLPIAAAVAAGRPAERPLRAGEAMGIATGGAVPDGADAVVPIEVSS